MTDPNSITRIRYTITGFSQSDVEESARNVAVKFFAAPMDLIVLDFEDVSAGETTNGRITTWLADVVATKLDAPRVQLVAPDPQ